MVIWTIAFWAWIFIEPYKPTVWKGLLSAGILLEVLFAWFYILKVWNIPDESVVSRQ